MAGNLNPFLQPSGPDYLAWLGARFTQPPTFTIDVTDSGLDDGTLAPDHPDFSGRIAYQSNYTGDSNARDCEGHGTNVASIAAGYNSGTGPANEDGDEFNYGLGVAPLGQIGASKIFDCNGNATGSLDPAAITESAYERPNDARISNNSWGTADGPDGLSPRPRSTTSSCATPSRAPSATSRWSRCSRRGTTETRSRARRTRATARSRRRDRRRT